MKLRRPRRASASLAALDLACEALGLRGEQAGQCGGHVGEPPQRQAHTVTPTGEGGGGQLGFGGGQRAQHVQSADAAQRLSRVAAGGGQAVGQQQRNTFLGGGGRQLGAGGPQCSGQ